MASTSKSLVSPGILVNENDQSYLTPGPISASSALVGPTVKGPVLIPTRVTSYNEYVRIFGDTFETDTYSGSTGKIQQEFLTSIAAKYYFDQEGDSLLVTRVANPKQFTPAISTNVATNTGSIASAFTLETLGAGAILNSCNAAVYNSSSMEVSGSLISGSATNLRFSIYGVDPDNGTFNLDIRQGDDSPKSQIVLERWRDLSLDPNSTNYIAAKIGDQKNVYHAEVSGSDGAYIETVGNYANNSNYVRVSMVKDTPAYTSASFAAALPLEQDGAFYSGSGIVGHCFDGSKEVSGSIDCTYFENIKSTSTYIQSVTTADYDSAIELMKNPEEYKIKVLVAPGLFNTSGSNAIISCVEERSQDGGGGCMAVIDVAEYGAGYTEAAGNAKGYDSSAAAAYWPWVQMKSATGKLVWCPASTAILGVYAFTDHQAAPWFAPAGMTRGSLSGVIQVERKLSKVMRDEVYKAGLNPLANMPGTGLVVYGQKTLKKRASALDRVNVRRLMIEVEDKVSEMANGVLFEQNTTALRNSFKSQVESYLSSIVQRNGLYSAEVNLDGNTDAAIDRNEFHCVVGLKPAKDIEFIYLTFTVKATGNTVAEA